MAGGFGASSDFMWDLYAGIGYDFNDRFSAVLGYRGTGVDYENDGFLYDVVRMDQFWAAFSGSDLPAARPRFHRVS